MNFGIAGAIGLKPGGMSNRRKASAAEEGVEGGGGPPPGVAMDALRRYLSVQHSPWERRRELQGFLSETLNLLLTFKSFIT